MRRRAALAVVVSLVVIACGGGTLPVRGPSALSYRFVIGGALESMRVDVCAEDGGFLPDALVPIHEAARAHLDRAELLVDGAPLRELALVDRDGSVRIALDGAPRGACVRYVVDLAPRAPGASLGEPARVGDDLFAPTSVWLLAPSPRDPEARYRARFELPEGVSASPFWPTDADGAWFDERAFAFVTYAAFGRLEVEPLAVPGGCVDLVTLDGALAVDREARARWLSAAAGASARVTGRFPAARATLMVLPSPPFPGMPVLFGVAGRGVRASVSLLVSSDATEAQLVPDWTVVHELAHLLTGYVRGDDAWLSEGLATHYEEVLRARAGLIGHEAAWRALDDGFRRGASEPAALTLREEAARMHERRSYTRVYWAGAAIVLRAEVQYRRAGGSLDAAVTRAWPRREERMTATELMTALDGEPNGPLAREAAAVLDGAAFPSLDEAYAWLGIVRQGDAIVLDDAAPGASARDALMNDSPPLASISADCDAR